MEKILLKLTTLKMNPIELYRDLFILLEEHENEQLPASLSSLQNIPKHIFGIFIILFSVPSHYYALDKKQYRDFTLLQLKLQTLMQEKSWLDEDIERVFSWVLGSANDTKLLLKAVSEISKTPYQTGYDRRSYRAPSDSVTIIGQQMLFFQSFFSYYWSKDRVDKAKTNRHPPEIDRLILEPLDLVDLITNSLDYRWLPNMIARAIDDNMHNLYSLIESIMHNEHATAKIKVSIIRSLLLSEQPKAWELVKQLVLVAGRQEGLRQSVFENLDECHPEALRFFIKVIKEHNLVRFSAVVRAIGVWTGLVLEPNETKAINNVLDWMSIFINDITQAHAALDDLQEKNSLKLYIALWSIGVFDIKDTLPILSDFISNDSDQKRMIASLFIKEIKIDTLTTPLFAKALGKLDLLIIDSMTDMQLGSVANILAGCSRIDWTYLYDQQVNASLFDHLHEQVIKTKFKDKTISGQIFSWDRTKFEVYRLYLILYNLVEDDHVRLAKLVTSYPIMASDARHYLVASMLREYQYQRVDAYHKLPKLSGLKRMLAMYAAMDKTDYAMETGFMALKTCELEHFELMQLFELFKRKNSKLRTEMLQLFSMQPGSNLAKVIDANLKTTHSEQIAGLIELISINQDKSEIEASVPSWLEILQKLHPENEDIKRFNAKLKTSLTNQASSGKTIDSLGLYDVNKISKTVEFRYEPTSIFPRYSQPFYYGLTKPLDEVQADIGRLFELYQSHIDYEYEIETYEGSKKHVLLGNEIAYTKYFGWNTDTVDKYSYFPLNEIWLAWFKNSHLQLTDLCIIINVGELSDSPFTSLKCIEDYYLLSQVKTFKNLNNYVNNPLNCIISALIKHLLLGSASEVFAYLKDLTLFKITQFIEPAYHEMLKIKAANTSDNITQNCYESRSLFEEFAYFLRFKIKPLAQFSKEEVKFCFDLNKWTSNIRNDFSFVTLLPSVGDISLYLAAHKYELITQDELFEFLCLPRQFRQLNEIIKYKNNKSHANLVAENPQIIEFYRQILAAILAVELKRGDSATPVTHIAKLILEIKGINYFIQIVTALNKLKLKRHNYIDNQNYSSVVDKQTLFSHYLESSYPDENETYDEFKAALNTLKMTDVRLIEIAMFAPQWSKWISDYLSWDGLESGIWWFHAHTKTSNYRSQNAMLESEIAKYSKLDVDEFKLGMVDIDWFENAYGSLGADRWAILYECAKYISDGIGHRRARINTDVLTQILTLEDVKAKIIEKRDQEFLRVFGLLALDEHKRERDILTRYEYLQQFLKESKQFGAQKQSSEAIAIQVAMDNLAQNAGFSDPIRLTFAMESEQVQSILANHSKILIDDIELSLAFNESGIASITVIKADKELKTIPAKLKKMPEVVALTNQLKKLLDQEKRARITLENAMINGETFLFSELLTLSQHPVLGAKLAKLVLITNSNHIGFLNADKFTAIDGNEIQLLPAEKTGLRIAHCFDFLSLGIWQKLQHYCFQNKVVQPFKQIFRELYTITDQERDGVLDATRYAGHQVNPKQALALLRSRGWKLDYEEGLQKNLHKTKIGIKLYANADWFSPSDIEAPTLECVCFFDLKKQKQLRLEEVPPILYSEVMRDIDLVISVAHVGSVDPKSSQSTIELRAHLLRETLQLFKLTNVEILNHHVKISGKLAQYSIHLGSGTVHQVGASAMPILPVHSQHRGKVFLPFIDDDPRSAEILSKVLLLANDEKIQDPTILRLIKRS